MDVRWASSVRVHLRMRVNTERLPPPADGVGGAEALVLEVEVAALPPGASSEPCIAIHGSAGGVGRRRNIRRERASQPPRQV